MRAALVAALVAVLAVSVLVGGATPAAAFCPAVSPGYDLADAEQGSALLMALVVPDAGPTTSEARARASLVRGEVRNSLRGDPPSGLPVFAPCERSRDAVVGIPEGGEGPNDRRYLLAVGHAGVSGLFYSRSTRLAGLVSIADIAHQEERLTVRPHDDPVSYLRALDERIRENGRARGPASGVAVVVIAALAFPFPRAAVLAFATVAATNLLLGIAGVSEPWLSVALLGLGALAAVPLARVLRSPVALGPALAGVVAAYGVSMAVDATHVALSPLGPSQNARFFGLSNLLATLLLVPALAGAALLWRRFGLAAVVALGAVALVAVGSSRLGADGGGALVLAAGFAVLAAVLLGRGRRSLAVAGGLALLAVALVAVDTALGPSTHVGASVRGGPGAVAGDLAGRIALSWARVTAGWDVALVVTGAVVALAVLVVRARHVPLSREARALTLAFAVAIGVSLVVNDSPLEVAVGGLVGYLALTRSVRPGEPRGLHWRGAAEELRET